MKFCSNCGTQLEDVAAFCPSCGTKAETFVEPTPAPAPIENVAPVEAPVPVVETVAPEQEQVAPVQEPAFAAQPVMPVEPIFEAQPVAPVEPAYVPQPSAVEVATVSAPSTDAPSKGFFALGFFFFPVGLILYFIFKNKSPQRAKSALKGFIIGTCIWVALVILWFILLAVISAFAGFAAGFNDAYYY